MKGKWKKKMLKAKKSGGKGNSSRRKEPPIITNSNKSSKPNKINGRMTLTDNPIPDDVCSLKYYTDPNI